MKVFIIYSGEDFNHKFRAVIYMDEKMERIHNIFEDADEIDLRETIDFRYPGIKEVTEIERDISTINKHLDKMANAINGFLDENTQKLVNVKIEELKQTVFKSLKG